MKANLFTGVEGPLLNAYFQGSGQRLSPEPEENDGEATVPVVLKPRQLCAAQLVFQSTGRIPRATVWRAAEQ